MTYSLNMSILNILFNGSKKGGAASYFSNRAAQLANSLNSSDQSTEQSKKQAAYKKVDLSVIDTLNQPKDQISVIAQALTNIGIEMDTATQSGYYTRGGDIAAEAKKVMNAVTQVIDSINTKDGVSDGTGALMKANKEAITNVLKALNAVQKSLSGMQLKVPNSQAQGLKDAIVYIKEQIQEAAKKADIKISTKTSATPAVASDPDRLVDMMV